MKYNTYEYKLILSGFTDWNNCNDIIPVLNTKVLVKRDEALRIWWKNPFLNNPVRRNMDNSDEWISI